MNQFTDHSQVNDSLKSRVRRNRNGDLAMIVRKAVWMGCCLGVIVGAILPLGAVAQQQAKGFNWAALNLSEPQAQHIHELDTRWQKQRYQLEHQIQQDHAVVLKLRMAPEKNRQQIETLENQIDQNNRRIREEAWKTLDHQKQLLSPEQQKKFDQLMGL